MSRYNELNWKYDDKCGEWQLYAPLYGWTEIKFLLARLKETDVKNEYMWTIADLKEESEAPICSNYLAYGFEEFESIDKAKERVISDLMESADSAVEDLMEIRELFY